MDVGIKCATDAKLTFGRFNASSAASRVNNSMGAAGVEVFLRFRLPPAALAPLVMPLTLFRLLAAAPLLAGDAAAARGDGVTVAMDRGAAADEGKVEEGGRGEGVATEAALDADAGACSCGASIILCKRRFCAGAGTGAGWGLLAAAAEGAALGAIGLCAAAGCAAAGAAVASAFFMIGLMIGFGPVAIGLGCAATGGGAGFAAGGIGTGPGAAAAGFAVAAADFAAIAACFCLAAKASAAAVAALEDAAAAARSLLFFSLSRRIFAISDDSAAELAGTAGSLMTALGQSCSDRVTPRAVSDAIVTLSANHRCVWCPMQGR